MKPWASPWRPGRLSGCLGRKTRCFHSFINAEFLCPNPCIYIIYAVQWVWKHICTCNTIIIFLVINIPVIHDFTLFNHSSSSGRKTLMTLFYSKINWGSGKLGVISAVTALLSANSRIPVKFVCLNPNPFYFSFLTGFQEHPSMHWIESSDLFGWQM